MRTRHFASLLLALTITACADHGPAPDPAIGKYTLTTINGGSLPQSSGDFTYYSGGIELKEDHTFGDWYEQSWQNRFRGLITVEGTWSRTASDSIRLTATTIVGAIDLHVDGTTVTNGTWVYARE